MQRKRVIVHKKRIKKTRIGDSKNSKHSHKASPKYRKKYRGQGK